MLVEASAHTQDRLVFRRQVKGLNTEEFLEHESNQVRNERGSWLQGVRA